MQRHCERQALHEFGFKEQALTPRVVSCAHTVKAGLDMETCGAYLYQLMTTHSFDINNFMIKTCLSQR